MCFIALYSYKLNPSPILKSKTFKRFIFSIYVSYKLQWTNYKVIKCCNGLSTESVKG